MFYQHEHYNQKIISWMKMKHVKMLIQWEDLFWLMAKANKDREGHGAHKVLPYFRVQPKTDELGFQGFVQQ